MARYFSEVEKEDDKSETTKYSGRTIESGKSSRKKNKDRKNAIVGKKEIKPDPYPGRASINPELLEKHSRGDGIESFKNVRTKIAKKNEALREKAQEFARDLAARSELLLHENTGVLEGDDLVYTSQIRQRQIINEVDEESCSKGFELHLPKFGPYSIDYTRNGRHLVLGGRRGHVAAFDWKEKTLACEINVMESVHDVQFLHTEQMFAVAQKKWTYIYDNQGIEIHCLKKLDNISKLEFLPYHFLLVAASEKGFLSWVDVSKGTLVSQYSTLLGKLNIMCQNPYNAVICCGHSKGTVSMWTPNIREPVAKILAHRQPLRAVAVDSSGTYMATGAMDGSLKIWDVRKTFESLNEYKMVSGISKMSFSGTGLLAVATATNTVEIFKNISGSPVKYPYMRHKLFKGASDLGFAPFEDVLGIGTSIGFSSILVPGSGIANFDGLENNPFQSKKQRQESEVKALLEKIQPELITLDPTRLGDIDVPSLQDKIEMRNSKRSLKPLKIKFEHRRKGKGSAVKAFHIKKSLFDEEKRKNILKLYKEGNVAGRSSDKKKDKKAKGLLERLL